MPADAPGVTTDDHQPRPDGDGDESSAPAGDGEPESSQTPPSSDTAPAGPPPADDSAPAGDAEATTAGASDTAATARPTGFLPDPGPMTETGAAPASDPDPASVPDPEPLPSTSGESAYGAPEESAYGSSPHSSSADPAGAADPAGSADPTAPSESADVDQNVGDPEVEPGSPLSAGDEPPPAPVLVPPGRQLLRGRIRGRHTASRSDRASRRGLSVNQRLWSISPWSVFKVSVLFYICLGLIVIVAGTLLYNAGRSVGTIEQAESFVSRMGAYGECMPTADVPEDAEFQEDDDKCSEGEVLVGGFTLDDGTLFRAAAIGVGILVVAGSLGNVLLIVLLNLLNELTGGVRHTIIKEPVARPPGSGSPRSPGGQVRSRGGSPRGQPQG